MEKKNLKILIVNYEFPPLGGGGGVATYDLALEWVKHGQVDILTSNFRGVPAYEKMDGINVYRTKIFFRKSRDAATFISMFSYLVTGFIKGLWLVAKNRYDVINTHFAVPSGPLGYILGKLFRIPNVLSLHGGDIYDPSKKMSPHDSFIFSRVVRFILNKADRIVAQSSNTRNNTLKYYSPVKEVEIIPLAFHPPVVTRSSRSSLGLDKDSFYLITIGRLIKRKSLDTLLYAMSGVKNKKIRLLIVGDGPEREYLQGIVRDKKLGSRVSFLGYLDDADKFRYLGASDVFILTSLHEGFGIVFMEAMHMGLPIIATNNGGQLDFLKPDENAILIDVCDVKGCSDAIIRLENDKTLYKRCSINNKKRIMEFYAEKVASEYIKIFNELTE